MSTTATTVTTTMTTNKRTNERTKDQPTNGGELVVTQFTLAHPHTQRALLAFERVYHLCAGRLHTH